jgi:exonuclease VII large subunit
LEGEIKMTRDGVKEILGEGATEEQVSAILNAFHSDIDAKDKEINSLNSKLQKQNDYDAIKNELEEIHKANMSEQEKLEEQKKEIAKNLHDSKIIVNTAKAKEILAGLPLTDDVINSLVRDDEETTITNATNLKTQIESLKLETDKKVREELANIDLKPSISNVPQDGGAMTWDKFEGMSIEEQNKFAEDHPDEFANL